MCILPQQNHLSRQSISESKCIYDLEWVVFFGCRGGRRRDWLRCGSSAGCRCTWWPLRRKSRARCRRPAASAQSRRSGDPDVRCRAEAWVRWSAWGRGSWRVPPAPSSPTVPAHCDAPAASTNTHTHTHTHIHTHFSYVLTFSGIKTYQVQIVLHYALSFCGPR